MCVCLSLSVYLVTMKNVANQCWFESDRWNIRESDIVKGRYGEPVSFLLSSMISHEFLMPHDDTL